MDQSANTQIVADRLDALMPKNIQFLEQRDPFRFLISVILSAQTTDKIVNVVVKQLFAAYPTAEALSKASQAEIESIIYPTGYYRNKAKSIVACATELVGKALPNTMEELVKLPGVGRKTASCVLGDIYGKPAIIVDTHFGRVVSRLGLVDANEPTKIEIQIKEQLAEEKQYRFSMTANLFGRTVCHAKKPQCLGCPLRDLCPSADAFVPLSSKK